MLKKIGYQKIRLTLIKSLTFQQRVIKTLRSYVLNYVKLLIFLMIRNEQALFKKLTIKKNLIKIIYSANWSKKNIHF